MPSCLFLVSADGDYVPISRTLAFAPFSSRQCVSMVILDDAKLEQTEAFRVTLELIDDLNGSVQLDGSLSTVAIFNDDGELTCNNVNGEL